MWRSLFLAVGLSLCILGGECLVVESATLVASAQGSDQAAARRVVSPPEWAPWSFLAAGAVVILYSFTIPKFVNG